MSSFKPYLGLITVMWQTVCLVCNPIMVDNCYVAVCMPSF